VHYYLNFTGNGHVVSAEISGAKMALKAIIIVSGAMLAATTISATVLASKPSTGLQPASAYAPDAKEAGIERPPLAKGDRLPVFVGGAACSSRSWPNYDQACQFDFRRSVHDVRKVRVLVLERDVPALTSVQILATR
jgi:hypothetical protein